MALLFDRIMSQGLIDHEGRRMVNWEDAVVFDIQNVADYYRKHYATQDGYEDAQEILRAFPNLAPPYKTVWMEYDAMSSTPHQYDVIGDRQRGVCIFANDVKTLESEIDKRDVARLKSLYEKRRPLERSNFHAWSHVAIDATKGRTGLGDISAHILLVACALRDIVPIRWVLDCYPIFEDGNRSPCAPMGIMYLPLFENGRIFMPEAGRRADIQTMTEWGKVLAYNYASYRGIQVDSVLESMIGVCRAEILYQAFLALSFMHCRNVVRKVIEPPKMNRQQRRHGFRQPVRYHVLDIEPMKQVLKNEGQVEKTGLKKALHICRGHFAHYTAEHPLFGKYEGTFWRPDHVRGSLDEGIVDKDYRVKRPKPVKLV